MSSHVDWDLLDAISEDWSMEFSEIYDEFVQELQSGWNELRDLCNSDSLDAARKQSHKLKGSSANFGFEGCRHIAESIERQLTEGSQQGIPELLSRGQEAIESSLKEVAERRKAG